MKRIFILLLSVFFVQDLLAQTISVSGVVSDASGQPVTGAVAVVKGSTTNAAVTDLDGNYRLDNVPASASIEVSCLGYETVVKRAAASLDFVTGQVAEVKNALNLFGDDKLSQQVAGNFLYFTAKQKGDFDSREQIKARREVDNVVDGHYDHTFKRGISLRR